MYSRLTREISGHDGRSPLKISDSSTDFYMLDFESSKPDNLAGCFTGSKYFDLLANTHFEETIVENYTFSFPAFVPREKERLDKAIIMLHGLNERKWDKYLVWAFYLSEHTGRPVLLFPISFHMNRSPSVWSSPREMSVLADYRKKKFDNTEDLSFANIALSNRLTENPLRFFVSGYQSASDIIKLLLSVRNGNYSFIKKDAGIDIFAYSIGAFLAEIMMLADPDGLLGNSKLFMFCGGSVFSGMNGSSKLIMDHRAYSTIYDYYLHQFEGEIDTRNKNLPSVLSGLIRSFRSFIDTDRLKPFREYGLNRLRDRIFTIGLEKDRVIPADSIMRTMGKGLRKTTRILDFPYSYSHENPFPVLRNKPDESRLIDRCFNMVFGNAVAFL